MKKMIFVAVIFFTLSANCYADALFDLLTTGSTKAGWEAQKADIAKKQSSELERIAVALERIAKALEARNETL